MKSLQNFLFLVLYVCFFIGCSKETKKEVKEAAEAVTAESKEQLSEMTDNAKDQVSETVEAVKSKTLDIVDKLRKRSRRQGILPQKRWEKLFKILMRN